MVNCPPLQNSKRCFKASTQIYQSERAWTPVVPRSSDVLKAQTLSSAFKTRRHNFAMDGKIMPAMVPNRNDVLKQNYS
ncbi:hypothetical protein [Treponema phagedenis]|uniref:hypothetical protein n=1 Tax=Treponema phagedenis TaxID=162 RepID=UPI003138C8ED